RRLRPAFASELPIIIVKYPRLLLPQQWQGLLSEKDRQIVFEERVVLPLQFIENRGFSGADRRLNIHGSYQEHYRCGKGGKSTGSFEEARDGIKHGERQKRDRRPKITWHDGRSAIPPVETGVPEQAKQKNCQDQERLNSKTGITS